MPPERFEEKFGIPSSHNVESQLTSALYRLPEEISPEHVERLAVEIIEQVEKALGNKGAEKLSIEQGRTLRLKLARHLEHAEKDEHLDIPALVDALVESPRFLQSDKGSIDKLYEIHEVKTLQKIAELRRKRAEMTNNEDFNPYEALFETDSGDYYMARLLNMPHLEEESRYMDHCVGTSDSYVNKMRNGQVEILSFREKGSNRPLVTIEYDLKSKRLLQVRTERDGTPTLLDAFTLDLLESLEKLSLTTTEAGEPRIIRGREVQNLRTLHSIAEKILQHEQLTRAELVALYEIDAPLDGFNNDRDPRVAELRAQRNPNEDMLVIFDCTQEQIAHVPSQINENTKAYIGPLEPNIFTQLQQYDIEHIYASFPDKKIHRENIKIGGKSAEQLISEIQADGNVSEYAEAMLKNKEFLPGEDQEVTLIRLTVADLGFTKNATTDQIYKRAQELGLDLCPAEVGPHYRLQYNDQPMNEWLRIAMKQIIGAVGYPSVFCLGRVSDGLWLNSYWAGPGREWHPNDEFLFCLRK